MDPWKLAPEGCSEHQHQRALMSWANMVVNYGFTAAWEPAAYLSADKAALFGSADETARLVKLLFAIPNGGARNPATASNLKAEGVKAGVPDLFLPVAAGGWHGLFVEMKKPGGHADATQKAWHKDLADGGYAVRLCFGWEEAAKDIQTYLVEEVL